MIFGTCKLHTTASGVMQTLCKFCLNKHLTRYMAIATFAAVLTDRRRPRPMTPSTDNPASIVLMSRSKLGADQALTDSSKQSMLEHLLTESLVAVVAGQ